MSNALIGFKKIQFKLTQESENAELDNPELLESNIEEDDDPHLKEEETEEDSKKNAE